MLLQLTPVDAWFFGDGRPYTQGEVDQSDSKTLFPPSPLTVSGGLRAAFARYRGWDGSPAHWGKVFAQVLGTGPNDTGQLRFRGPFVYGREEVLFSTPRHVSIRPDDGMCGLLTPDRNVACDLGDEVRVAAAEDNSYAEARGFVTAAALQRIVMGQRPAPDSILGAADIGALPWSTEARVGLMRDPQTRTTGEEGDLYAPVFVRLRRGYSLVVDVAGLPSDWTIPKLVALGGEGRLAYVDQLNQELSIPAIGELPRERFCLVCLTPLKIPVDRERPVPPLPGQDFPRALGLKGVTLISAFTDRPMMLGGWDSTAGRPLPLHPFLAPGSVLFCERTTDGGNLELALKRLVTGNGCNVVTVGLWPTT
jgi:CRISPR type III-B/RAMP module-associated protein Cmr3